MYPPSDDSDQGTTTNQSNNNLKEPAPARPPRIKAASIQTQQRILIDRVGLGIITYLESLEECLEISLQSGKELSNYEILAWEKRYSPLKLPQDLKKFYTTVFNGFSINWTIEVNDQIIPVGDMRINSLEDVKIQMIPEICMLPYLPPDVTPPTLSNCTLFSLDSRCSLGTIVLLYRCTTAMNSASSESKEKSFSEALNLSVTSSTGTNLHALESPEVWLLTNSCQLIYLCGSFVQYMRLMIAHLGIFHWQLAFSDDGLPTLTEQYMQVFCKERLIIDKHYRMHA